MQIQWKIKKSLFNAGFNAELFIYHSLRIFVLLLVISDLKKHFKE